MICFSMLPHVWGLVCFLMFMVTMSETEMNSLQDMESNREQGILLDRDTRAPFNGMRGKRYHQEDKDTFSRVGFVIIINI